MAKTKVTNNTKAAIKAEINKYPEWYYIHVEQAYTIKYPKGYLEPGYEFGPKYHEAHGAAEALRAILDSLNVSPENESLRAAIKEMWLKYARRADSFQVAVNCYVKAKVAEHNEIATELHKQRMAARRAMKA